MAGHPFTQLISQPGFDLLSWQIVCTAQAGGPPSVAMGWAIKSIIFKDVRRGANFHVQILPEIF